MAVQNLVGGRLLILVDEYDQPIREGLLPLIPHHGPELYQRVKEKLDLIFPSYFGFFRAVKVALDEMPHAKIFLTGILPIAIKEMSGLPLRVVTFESFMGDAVGLTDEDVRNMLDRVDQYAPFKEGEQEVAKESIKRHFSNLSFPGSSPLYHTALLNEMMNILLQNGIGRKNFLLHDIVPDNLMREKIAPSVYDVLGCSRNLRCVANRLAERCPVTGYKVNKTLSLEDLLRANISVDDYLTLLLHVGVVSVTGNTSETFKVTSDFYRMNLLETLLKTLRDSLEVLTSFTTTNDLYGQGESILEDFVTSISQNRMAALMAWAASDPDNHILELQFQSHVVTDAHYILEGKALTTQENILPLTGKRTDVTFSSESCVVILELKQVATATELTQAFIQRAHDQLTEYVQTRREMEKAGENRPVAGFLVVMYNDGDSYVVEKLRNDKEGSQQKGI